MAAGDRTIISCNDCSCSDNHLQSTSLPAIVTDSSSTSGNRLPFYSKKTRKSKVRHSGQQRAILPLPARCVEWIRGRKHFEQEQILPQPVHQASPRIQYTLIQLAQPASPSLPDDGDLCHTRLISPNDDRHMERKRRPIFPYHNCRVCGSSLQDHSGYSKDCERERADKGL